MITSCTAPQIAPYSFMPKGHILDDGGVPKEITHFKAIGPISCRITSQRVARNISHPQLPKVGIQAFGSVLSQTRVSVRQGYPSQPPPLTISPLLVCRMERAIIMDWLSATVTLFGSLIMRFDNDHSDDAKLSTIIVPTAAPCFRFLLNQI